MAVCGFSWCTGVGLLSDEERISARAGVVGVHVSNLGFVVLN